VPIGQLVQIVNLSAALQCSHLLCFQLCIFVYCMWTAAISFGNVGQQPIVQDGAPLPELDLLQAVTSTGQSP